MRQIASLIAVPFALLMLQANGHMAAAPTAQSQTKTPAKSITVTAPKAPEQPATAPNPAPSPVVVAVQQGDTLSSIAAANGTTYTRLYDANESISSPDVIRVGDQVTIPAADAQLPDRALPTPPPAAPVAPAPVQKATPTPAPKAVSVATLASDGGSAKAFIYSHESGNNPNATNPAGCYGLGQDCNGHVKASCGADYACQDAYFTNYAMSRYGSWEGAKAFWQTHGWW